jgi:pimeloyl-ACP methyl ester carboxylesterase
LKRRWKILIGVVVALAVLLAVNTIVLDNQTKEAELTVDGGEILSLPGGDVQVTDSGEPAGSRPGAPIVLLHCFDCSLHWWDSMLPLLSENHRVIRIDLLGHGGSAKPKTGYEIEDQGALVAAALDRLGVQGAVIVGHSLGGTVAVSLAEQASQLVDRVVIIDQAPNEDFGDSTLLDKLAGTPVIGEAMWRVKIDSLVKNGFEVAFAPGFDQADGFSDPDQVVLDNEAMTYTSFDASPEAEDDYSGAIPLDTRMRTTAVPLMVIFGAEDQLYDADEALAAYQEAVPGARVATIEDAGHSPNVEQPEETAALIQEFAADAGDETIEGPPRDVGREQDKPRRQERQRRRQGKRSSKGK